MAVASSLIARPFPVVAHSVAQEKPQSLSSQSPLPPSASLVLHRSPRKNATTVLLTSSFCGQQLSANPSRPARDGVTNGRQCRGGRKSFRKTFAVLDFFQRFTPGTPSPSGFDEKPAFAPRDKRMIGGMDVSPMGLGTWAWGNKLLWGYNTSMDPELQRVFDLVVSRGVNLFDTADSYGTGQLNGRSEQLLGKFIREYPGSEKTRGNIRIATKLAAYPWRLTTWQMLSALRGSLRRLGADQLAIGQLHWSTANYAPPQERVLWDSLVAMHDQGLVECVGVSNYGPKQLERIHTYLDKRGVRLASAQVQYSLVSKGAEQEQVRQLCDELGVQLIAYSPLGLGMLTGKYDASNMPQGPRGVLFKQILPGLSPLLDTMAGIAQRRKKTMSQVAINWCICQGTIPIPGAKDLAQAEENLGAMGWRLSGRELEALDESSAAIPKGMVQNIFQTK